MVENFHLLFAQPYPRCQSKLGLYLLKSRHSIQLIITKQNYLINILSTLTDVFRAIRNSSYLIHDDISLIFYHYVNCNNSLLCRYTVKTSKKFSAKEM